MGGDGELGAVTQVELLWALVGPFGESHDRRVETEGLELEDMSVS